jgi:hypothetical protein
MLKGASRGVLKFIEQELHEAWCTGRKDGRRELVVYAVPEILWVRFGPGVRDAARAVAELTADDRLEEILVRAAIGLDFNSFSYHAVMPRRKRRNRIDTGG